MPSWIVSAEESDEKLASFIKAHSAQDASLRKIKSWIDAGLCYINRRREKFHHTRLRAGDRIDLIIPEESKPINLKESLLFEDPFILVCNKPPGVVCDESTEKRIGALLVHRLDKDTSGVLLFAKSVEIRTKLFDEFRQRKVHKEYVAVVDGIVKKEKGTIENVLAPLKRFQGQTIWGASKDGSGDEASTDWKVLQRGKTATLMRLYPHTGRTHQLRVHMKGIGHPIVGDIVYGGAFLCSYPATRQLLHAEKLTLTHPVSNKKMEFTAPMPEYFAHALSDH